MKLLLVAAAVLASTGLSLPSPPPPPVKAWPIPFGQKRKHEMARYSQRHYGERSWRLRHPRVIVEHMAQSGSAAAVRNTFARDVPDPELHELPNVCSHFVVADSGRIFRLVNLRTRCRHTVGLNWTAIGIEPRRLRRRRRPRRPSPAARLPAADPLAALPLRDPPARRDRPRREPQLPLPSRAGPQPAPADAR